MRTPKIIALCVSIAVFGYSVSYVYLARRTLTWPKTRGRVIRSQVIVSHDGDGRSERADFAYEYEVGGRRFESSAVTPGWDVELWSSNVPGVSTARRIVRKYPPEAVVTVRYSPTDPAQCCLVPGGVAGGFFLMVLSFGAGVAAVAHALLAR